MFLTEISNFEAFDDVIDDIISHDPFVATPLFNKQLFSTLDLCRCFPTEISNSEALMTSSMTSYRMTVLQPLVQ